MLCLTMKDGQFWIELKKKVAFMDNVILNKSAIIERCIQRIHEVHQGNRANLDDLTKQDSIILNIQRACEAAIDIAMHLVSVKRLGLPQSSREAFELLEQQGLISETLLSRLKGMVGFRNIAVHNYQVLKLDIIEMIIEHRLKELITFKKIVLKTALSEP